MPSNISLGDADSTPGKLSYPRPPDFGESHCRPNLSLTSNDGSTPGTGDREGNTFRQGLPPCKVSANAQCAVVILGVQEYA